MVEGVEQSFVFEKPFAADGDLVIRGAIETPLFAEPRAFSYGAIGFVDERGRAVLRYGAGFAIDASGCVAEIESR
ncbi:MAG: hypothetical protein JNM84_21095, partial [Planctomycetes bacterium]|nr:hypothetical protein [Planctomycetota bacterium]